jgi:hypothetical protein
MFSDVTEDRSDAYKIDEDQGIIVVGSGIEVFYLERPDIRIIDPKGARTTVAGRDLIVSRLWGV